MDDLNALERQIESQLNGFVGPALPVDDAAIFTTITASQSPKWRFQTMFSATKFIVAGAIVALFGGFVLAGVLTQPTDDSGPAAVPSATAQVEGPAISPPVEFSGQVICGPLVRTGTTNFESWDEGQTWTEQRGDAWRQTVTMSDPRLEGEIFIGGDTYTYSQRGSDGIERATITLSIHRIENDGGAWQGPAVSLDLPGEPAAFTPGDRQTFLLTGEGGYAGLTAIYDLVANPDYRPCGADVYGLIFEGDATPEAYLGQ